MTLVKLMAALLAVALSTVAISSAEARITKHPSQKIQRVIRDVTLLYAGLDQFSARRHRHASRRAGQTHHARRGGACDGIHRCRCGSTQATHFGLPRIYNGYNLWLASEWGRAFPHTSFHVGAIGVKPGHVLRVVGGSSCSSAIVSDDAGTYQRNVCGMTFVAVGGGTRTTNYIAPPRYQARTQYASTGVAGDIIH